MGQTSGPECSQVSAFLVPGLPGRGTSVTPPGGLTERHLARATVQPGLWHLCKGTGGLSRCPQSGARLKPFSGINMEQGPATRPHLYVESEDEMLVKGLEIKA